MWNLENNQEDILSLVVKIEPPFQKSCTQPWISGMYVGLEYIIVLFFFIWHGGATFQFE